MEGSRRLNNIIIIEGLGMRLAEVEIIRLSMTLNDSVNVITDLLCFFSLVGHSPRDNDNLM